MDADDGKTVSRKRAAIVGPAGHFADLRNRTGQGRPHLFTFEWRQDDRWEGRNFEVRLEPVEPETEEVAASSYELARATSTGNRKYS